MRTIPCIDKNNQFVNFPQDFNWKLMALRASNTLTEDVGFWHILNILAVDLEAAKHRLLNAISAMSKIPGMYIADIVENESKVSAIAKQGNKQLKGYSVLYCIVPNQG